jgi:DNA-damage-inducible protein D
MEALGYDTWPLFKKALNKAIGACTTLGISVVENFVQCSRPVDGKSVEDFQLSRLACCLTAINGDTSKPNVAAAQIYFIALAAVLNDVALPPDAVDRILIRQEISELEVTLGKTAAQAGVEFFDRFQNAGYRGMYNMDLTELKLLKGIPDMRRSLLDFMKKDELAGNLFRLTLTEGRIKKDNVRGQLALEKVAEQVGRRVRQTIIDETGIKPETLPIGPDIREVRKGVRNANRGFRDIDNVAKERAAEGRATQEAEHDIALTASGVVPDCPECLAGSAYAHFGSPNCTSGSLASGGPLSHCRCDYCSPAAQR